MLGQLSKVLAITIVFWCFCSTVQARPGRPLEVAPNIDVADLICVGYVEMTTDQMVGDPKLGICEMKASFHVDRVLKGDVTPGSTAIIGYSGNMMNWPSDLDSLHHYLVLLRRVGADYTFALANDSTMIVSPDSKAPYIKSPDVKYNLRQEVLNSLEDTDTTVVQNALRQASVLTDDDLAVVVKPLTNSLNAKVRADAVRVCLDRGDMSVVGPTLDYIESMISQGGMERMYTNGLSHLVYTLRRQDVGNAHVREFGRALDSKLDIMREVACYALRTSKNHDATASLKSALEDSNSEVRYHAVMGLADLSEDHQHGPAIDIFRSDEATYLDYWRAKTIP